MFSFSNKVILLLFTLLFVSKIKAEDLQGHDYHRPQRHMDIRHRESAGSTRDAQK